METRKASLGTAFIAVTHELASISRFGNPSIYLNSEMRVMTVSGDPKRLLAGLTNPNVCNFPERRKKGSGQKKSKTIREEESS
ncbi:MAG TPA: hypothetical protein VKF36_16515 [Syntrophorhabdales bacterium]|nr:hypothetical protein [Syntrophorhabdales bacterium]